MNKIKQSSVQESPLRVPCDLPQMLVGILEVTGIAAPERVVGRLHDRCSRCLRLLHDRVHLGLRSDVVPERELGRARPPGRYPGIVRNARARPERELEAGLEIEERYRAVLELRSDDALGLEAEAVAIEAQRPLEVVHAEGDEGDSRLHGRS